MTKPRIRINHDKVADVFYIIFGDAKPSYAEDVGDGVYARYDMETDELTGITILDFSKRSKSEVLELIMAEKIIPQESRSDLDFLH